ncbi:serine protease inhibitor 27A-like [Anticarsia gemmatalis]|uniref:serine protease inhibitor 27A-like n=1 Tax=Anticarsia gemmatalis TaxID=129554 RepID=UPI003F777ABB
MNFKILTILVTLCCTVSTYQHYRCSYKSTLHLHKRPAYLFSVRLLRRVAEDTRGHFVFSPLSTWMQLGALAEGARGDTLREIWNVTRLHRNPCYRKMLGKIYRNTNKNLGINSRRQSVLAIDRFMDVKKPFVRFVERNYDTKVWQLDFNRPLRSADKVNQFIEHSVGGGIDRILLDAYFNSSVMLLSDANYFNGKWQVSFNSGAVEPFYSSQGGEIGQVNMMTQTGYFHVSEFPIIKAKVLEIPFENNKTSVLVFLPTEKDWVGEMFYNFENTSLTSIFNLFKRQPLKLVNVKLPKFNMTSEVDNLPELLYDMGLERMFNTTTAEFGGISKFKLNTSFMTQVTRIDVDEDGVTVGPGFTATNDTKFEDFVANKPFVFMIVNKRTEFILYAGVYSEPSV